MLKSLGEWEFTKNVKITLIDGEIVYCDIDVWVDDDPEGIVLLPNEKTTNEWLLGKWIGTSIDIIEIEKIEKL